MAEAEDDFKMSLEPISNEVTFKGSLKTDKTEAMLTLKNTLEKRAAFKVKCTSNAMFRIRPAVGLLSPGEEAKIRLICSKVDSEAALPADRRHYFAAYHIEAPDDADNGRKVWADHAPAPDPKPRRVFVLFNNAPQ